jgi:hypothetical protein
MARAALPGRLTWQLGRGRQICRRDTSM